MTKYKVIAKDDLNTDRHTWTKGLDYEVVDKGDYFTLCSDQGSLNYFNEVKEQVLAEFEVVKLKTIFHLKEGDKLNKLFLVSGHSGGGKTTIMRSLMNNEIVSFTTRDKRPGEVDGVDYKYITENEFFNIKKSGEIIEWTQYSGNYYGIDAIELNDKVSKGHSFCIVDFNGLKQFKEFYPNITTIFIYTDFDQAQKQMQQRGDDADKINQRLFTYQNELNNSGYYDYVIKNNHNQLHRTTEIIRNIIESELEV